MNTIAKLITTCGGVKSLSANIKNPPYMRLVIEDIRGGPCGFAEQWGRDRNLCEQGFVAAAVQQQAKVQGAKGVSLPLPHHQESHHL